MDARSQDEPRSFDTVIIGAGIAGLACAARLHESASHTNKHTFAVLEARDRIGGRIESVNVHGCRLDTGANWIHGTGTKEAPNPILEFTSNFRPLGSSVAFRVRAQGESGSAASASANLPGGSSRNDLVIPGDEATGLFYAFLSLMHSLHQQAEKLSPDEARDEPMLSAILRDRGFQEALQQVPAEFRESLTGLPQILEGMEAAPLNEQSAEGSEDRPGMSMLEFATDGFDGAQAFLHDGYTDVVNKLAAKILMDDHVKLNTEVLQIAWSSDPIRIITNNGIYTARNVVCTLPLGVLKHTSKQSDLSESSMQKAFFNPELPTNLQEAVSSLGFGTLDKIFLVYEHPWWTEEPYSSILGKGLSKMDASHEHSHAAEPDSLRGFVSELQGPHITADGVETGPAGLFVLNLHALTGFPVLSAFLSCKNARSVELLPQDEAALMIRRALSDWLGGIEVPLPKAVHRTTWAQDKFSRGSYSHMITGRSERKHREAFHTPITSASGTQLRFAGEHTHLDDFATAHGALISGRREADALLAQH